MRQLAWACDLALESLGIKEQYPAEWPLGGKRKV